MLELRRLGDVTQGTEMILIGRSSFSGLLNFYLNRLDDKIEKKCPKCQTTPHDTNHLLNWQANPTSLWTHPIEASNFLGVEELKDSDQGQGSYNNNIG